MSSAITDSGARIIEEGHKYFNEVIDSDLVSLHRQAARHVVETHTAAGLRSNDELDALLDKFYDIPTTVDLLFQYSALVKPLQSVTLQFPDDLLGDAARIVLRLKKLLRERFAAHSAGKTTRIVRNYQNQQTSAGDIEDAVDGNSAHGLYLTSERMESSQAVEPSAQPSASTALVPPELYVLGDTTYSSCCVDEIAAQHVSSDFILHYGNACLQRVTRNPVHHIFGKSYSIDLDACESALKEYASDDAPVVVLYDLPYFAAVAELRKRVLSSGLSNIVFARPDWSRVTQNIEARVLQQTGLSTAPEGFEAKQEEPAENLRQFEVNGLRFEVPSGPFKFFYVGEDSVRLTQIMMDYSSLGCPFGRFSGVSNAFDDGSFATSRVSRMLKKRYYMVHQAREAQVFGILVATVTVADYMQILQQVKELIRAKGKKYYIFYVGKLNVPKLANFSEVDMYVLISCQQNALIDSKEFFKPIITPFELDLALRKGPEAWTGEFVSDFTKLLHVNDGAQPIEEKQAENAEDETDYSFLSGSVRKLRGNFVESQQVLSAATEGSSVNKQLANASDDRQIAVALTENSPALRFLHQRAFMGLEQNLGETPAAEMVEGREGIARGYTHEEETRKEHGFPVNKL